MTDSAQLERWFRDARAVATLVPAERLFGMLRRTLDLPATFAALARRTDGRAVLVVPGGKVTGDDVRDVLFVRSSPWEAVWEFQDLAAKDKYLFNARVVLALRTPAERIELEALRDHVLGSRAALDIDGVTRHLAAAVEHGLRQFVLEHEAESLSDGRGADAAGAAVTQALGEPCFSSGLVIARDPVVTLTSPSFHRIRRAEERAARELDEHAAQSELRAALAGAQRAHLDHLESMLARLSRLAESSPNVELAELMRSFEESQRGQLYQALFASRASRRVSDQLAVVAGLEALFFDAHAPGPIVRRVRIEGPAGALRSIQYDLATRQFLVGAARGVYLLPQEADAPQTVLLAGNDRAVRGGFNAVALLEHDVVATHSELGIVHWRVDQPDSGQPILVDLAQGAAAVRSAQFAEQRFWCTIDDRIVSVSASDLSATPEVISAGAEMLSALHVCGGRVFAGTADGDVLAWTDLAADAALQRLHGGSRRPVESLQLVEASGISRLFFTDTTLAVYCRVIGDAFTCRYEAGGQTIRRAVCAPDVLAATTDARDRVLFWTPDAPQRPAAIVNVTRLTGHSVQDICLVPRES